MITKKRILAAMLAAPAALALAAPAQAQAQVNGIATANPIVAMGSSKAFSSGNEAIYNKYKKTLDDIDAQQKARQAALAKLDKNGDKNVDDAELKAAEAAKAPALKQVSDADAAIAKLSEPLLIAQAFVVDQVAAKYDTALNAVVTARKIGVILTPESFVYAPDSADVTRAITAEMDKSPNVTIDVPATYKVSRQSMQLVQSLTQFVQYTQMVRAMQQRQQQQQGQQTQPARPAPSQPGKPEPR